jgi:hypothetical protein
LLQGEAEQHEVISLTILKSNFIINNIYVKRSKF